MYILALAHVMGMTGPLCEWPADPSLRIIETSGMRAHPPILTRLFDYRNTFFEHRLPAINGVAVEFADLQALHYESGSLDVVISAEVLEHVRLHRVAFAEICRVLKPGGTLVLQVPFVPGWRLNDVFVLADGQSDIYLCAPEFHDGPALVYRIYGQEVLGELEAAGFEVEMCEADVPECRIVPQSLIVARKRRSGPDPEPLKRDDKERALKVTTAWGRLDRYAWPMEMPAPRVSVIVPCHNHAQTTAACLEALRRMRTNVPFEIVAVDDASSDDTPQVLAAAARQLPRMKVFTIGENCGFSYANNHASYVAEGEFLLFLNNDTEVRDGCLDAFVELMERRPDAGAVGAKLIYPDGKLQEAGGIIFNDASGCNYGRFDDPTHPDYNFVREVDYVSGAALCVRRDLFRRLGRFDGRFSPAYYEDTDLCFAIREAGRRVLYCPFAEVVHHEGVTNSTDLAQGIKRFQAVHRQTFVDKWSARLREQPASTSEPRRLRVIADRRVRNGRQLLFTADLIPLWDRVNGALDMDQFARLVHQAGHHVTFVAQHTTRRGDVDWDAYVRRLQGLGIMVSCLDRRPRELREPADAFERLLEERDYAAALLWSAHEAPFFLDVIQRASPMTRTVVDAGDVAFVRETRRLMLAARARLAQTRPVRHSSLE